MEVKELKQQLKHSNFDYWRDDEFHIDVYSNESAYVKVGTNVISANLEVHIDCFLVRVIWYYKGRNKVSKSYYLYKEIAGTASLEELFSSFISETSTKYKIDI